MSVARAVKRGSAELSEALHGQEKRSMAKQTKTSKPAAAFELPKMEFTTVDIPIIGDTPLISNKWSDEQIAKIKAKQEGIAMSPQGPRIPQKEYEATIYRTEDGRPAFPCAAFKRAAVEACRLVPNLAMTEARILFHVLGDFTPVLGNGPRFRQDMRKLESGTSDPVYRAEYPRWAAVLRVRFISSVLSLEQMVNLINMAGVCGVGAWRPSAPKGKSGNYGMFHVDQGKEIQSYLNGSRKPKLGNAKLGGARQG